MDLQQLLHGAASHLSHAVILRLVCHRELQGCVMGLHQLLPELCHEPLILVHCNHQQKPVLTNNMVEEGISDSIHVCALQWDQ